MKYLRTVDFSKFPEREFHSEIVAHWETGVESCMVILTRVPPGTGTGAGGVTVGLHKHSSDQFYYTLKGAMTLCLADTQQTLAPSTLVHLPAEYPHWNWNEGSEDELHLEIIVPSPMSMDRVFEAVKDVPPAEELKRLKQPSVRQIETADMPAFGPFNGVWLTNRDLGSEHISMYLAEIPAQGAGPDLHIHAFDQFYYVLEGTLNVQVGLEEFEAGPHSLVVLPAGVPHRQWNAGAQPERHVVLIVPEPLKGEPFDIPVLFGEPEEPPPPTPVLA